MLTLEEKDRWYADRKKRLQETVAAMSEPTRLFFQQWCRCIELCGRAQSGDQTDFVLRFAEELKALTEPAPNFP